MHAPRRGVLVAEVADHLAVAVDRDALGDQVFLDHVDEAWSPSTYSAWLRVGEAVGVEVRGALQLHDAPRDLVGVYLLLVGVLRGTPRPRRRR